MAKYVVDDTSLTAVADAIRAKTGETGALIFPDGMVEAISRIVVAQESPPYTLTSADMSVGMLSSSGYALDGTVQIYTTDPIYLKEGTVSINISHPYQWICYYSSKPLFGDGFLLGKTSFSSDGVDDVLKAPLWQGTVEGAKYIRISLRDSTSTDADLTDRIDEFMSAITITVTP